MSMDDSTAMQHEFALSSMLILPDSFGCVHHILKFCSRGNFLNCNILFHYREIFLGNTFSSYISVINPYTCELRDVGLSANIQCANDRVELHDNRYARTGKLPPPNPVAVLPAGSSLDMVVDYPLNQVGNHVLRVGVAYVDPVTGRASRCGNSTGLQCRTHCIKFLPLAPFTAEEMVVHTGGKKGERPSIEELLSLSTGPQTLVYPQEELQRVFRVWYDPASDPSLLTTQVWWVLFFIDNKCMFLIFVFTGLLQGSQNLGRLHVGWKTSMGEAGSVQSQPVMRKVPGASGAGQMSEVIVAMEELPKEVVVGQPFLAAVSVTNNSTRSLALQLQFRKELMRGIVCSSASHQNLGLMEAKTAQTVWIEFFPNVGGLQVLGGPVCVDIRSGQEFTQASALAHVLVGPPSSCKTL
ncbi:Protein of unknown function DUF974 [Phytophthora cactorum]|nr:Protein of unknown function DUF974 [Phytophthora cactorum]